VCLYCESANFLYGCFLWAGMQGSIEPCREATVFMSLKLEWPWNASTDGSEIAISFLGTVQDDLRRSTLIRYEQRP